jgi:hypothetical protein
MHSATCLARCAIATTIPTIDHRERGERSKAKLINDFIKKLGNCVRNSSPSMGIGFDLPVLRYRAMVNRIAAAGLQVRAHGTPPKETAMH